MGRFTAVLGFFFFPFADNGSLESKNLRIGFVTLSRLIYINNFSIGFGSSLDHSTVMLYIVGKVLY